MLWCFANGAQCRGFCSSWYPHKDAQQCRGVQDVTPVKTPCFRRRHCEATRSGRVSRWLRRYVGRNDHAADNYLAPLDLPVTDVHNVQREVQLSVESTEDELRIFLMNVT